MTINNAIEKTVPYANHGAGNFKKKAADPALSQRSRPRVAAIPVPFVRAHCPATKEIAWAG